jgi:hypothetical protein
MIKGEVAYRLLKRSRTGPVCFPPHPGASHRVVHGPRHSFFRLRKTMVRSSLSYGVRVAPQDSTSLAPPHCAPRPARRSFPDSRVYKYCSSRPLTDVSISYQSLFAVIALRCFPPLTTSRLARSDRRPLLLRLSTPRWLLYSLHELLGYALR